MNIAIKIIDIWQIKKIIQTPILILKLFKKICLRVLKIKTFTWIMIIAFTMQATFWVNFRMVKPELEIVPTPISELSTKALSLGDHQFYFRVLALDMQVFGDHWGTFTPLKNYDYSKLVRWFYLLDKLDNKSNFVPSIASYYYSATQNTNDVSYLIDYLLYHSKDSISKNWWWITQAIYLANSKLKNPQLAREISLYLQKDIPASAPVWVKYLPLIYTAKLGENEKALKMLEILRTSIDKKEITTEELNYMNFFIRKHLKILDLEFNRENLHD